MQTKHSRIENKNFQKINTTIGASQLNANIMFFLKLTIRKDLKGFHVKQLFGVNSEILMLFAILGINREGKKCQARNTENKVTQP